MLDIKNLIQNLLTLESHQVRLTEIDNVKIGTTIRLDSEIREFLEQYTQALGISLQEMIAMILKAVMLQSKNTLFSTHKLNQIFENFLAIFNTYNISYLDVNKLLETSKFPPSSFLKSDLILDQLDEIVLQKMADIFYINKDWLKGLDEKNVHIVFESYPSIAAPINFLDSLSNDPTIEKVSMILCYSSLKEFSYDVLLKAKSENITADQLTEIIPVLEIAKKINGIKVISHQVLNGCPWNYQKYRFYLKALILIFYRRGKSINLGTLDPEYFSKFSKGHCLPTQIIQQHLRLSSFDAISLVKDNEFNPERNEQEYFESFYSEAKYDKYEKLG